MINTQKQCKKCNKLFNKPFGWSYEMWGKTIYCSQRCYHDSFIECSIPLNQIQKSLLVGSLLGDGNLSMKGERAKNAMYAENHCERQKPYLEWKYKILNNLCNKEIQSKWDKRFNLYIYGFYTKCTVELTKMYRWFYPNGKKKIPKELMDNFDELVFIVWYLDDGNNMGQQVRITTDGFDYKENCFLRRIIHKKFNIQPTLQMYKRDGKKRYNLYFGQKGDAVGKFMIIAKRCFEKYNIPDCMKYKLIERVESRREDAQKLLNKNLSRNDKGKFCSVRCAPNIINI